MKEKFCLIGAILFTTLFVFGCLNGGPHESGGFTQQGNLSSKDPFTGLGPYYSGPWVVECVIWNTALPSDTATDQIYIRQDETEAWFVPSHKWFQNSQSKGVTIYGYGYEGFAYKLIYSH